MMNIRVLTGFLAQKMVKVRGGGGGRAGQTHCTPHASLPACPASLLTAPRSCLVPQGLTQVIAGVALLVAFAGPAMGGRFTELIAAAVLASVTELVLVSLLIRQRHRMARSALGRLYGFSYDVFSSIHGVIAMALQRTFAGEDGVWGRAGG